MFAAFVLSAAIAAASQRTEHVPTADYWGGYSGTHVVSAPVAAQWLTWASVNIDGSNALRPLGVKTMLYTDPNRQIKGEPLYTADETTFAHDCAGARIPTGREGQYLMDPRSASMPRVWKNLVDRYTAEGHFDAIFEDDADDLFGVRNPRVRSTKAPGKRPQLQCSARSASRSFITVSPFKPEPTSLV